MILMNIKQQLLLKMNSDMVKENPGALQNEEEKTDKSLRRMKAIKKQPSTNYSPCESLNSDSDEDS